MRTSCFTPVVGLILVNLAVSRAAEYQAVLFPYPEGYDAFRVAGVSETGAFVGTGSGPATGGAEHALLWDASTGIVVDLHPDGYQSSRAVGGSGKIQGGTGRLSPGYEYALLWSGTTESVVNLHPEGIDLSNLTAMSAHSQVGVGNIYDENDFLIAVHALMWRGTAESAVDLHPTGYFASYCEGASDTHQVGHGAVFGDGFFLDIHALLWNGTPESVVDLHPPSELGFFSSNALGVSGGQQIGYGAQDEISPVTHALLWNGTAESVVDLHPTGFFSSTGLGIAGDTQIGFAQKGEYPNFIEHAYAWHGTAQSGIDLHPFVQEIDPSLTNSQTTYIAENGTIYGFANAGSESGASKYIVKWVPVVDPPRSLAVSIAGPEPAPGGGRQITLTWPGLPGDQFNVEASSTFEPGSWQVVHTTTAANGETTLSATLPVSGNLPWSFYRVVLIGSGGN